ncbi:ATP-dependent nuclease [Natranaerobius thermophilus]|uniref:ATP-dependent endonuclease family protein n=1 Tax=Natranaerobius thermophilus (strain ATCC BAA-1301 / DSM 18059 / JW/NM-WN-LF) TaxID=457570 RepID=B2A3Z5_NATTJ|nr:AAA family ATPase [Natranaerobius thermophilus]ACB85097.1 ATP-dependent endonuclease family protein [Natranaerobius thermophilus JW/NM-WN-LF]
MIKIRVAKIKINNFRGIKFSELIFPEHTVFVGDNNSGKSTILEALDLTLGPERLFRTPVIDEHDFYAGEYLDNDNNPINIEIEVVIINLNEEQSRYFRNNIEWWDQDEQALINEPPPEKTDKESVQPALRVRFEGNYDSEEDDFFGRTYYASPEVEDGSMTSFTKKDKRYCGFLFLRTLRTGSRALSLENGSLLDIILRLQELKLPIWEEILKQLDQLKIAAPDSEINQILREIESSIHSFVPNEWANNPQMKVSGLTRQNLKKIITFFMGTGATRSDGSEHSAPFKYQGTGTINTMVLTLLSMIAELKQQQNVIFAMEEPEIAIPPHTQKRIIHSICSKSDQAIFTSHSPYVLEEFDPSQILVLSKSDGIITGKEATYPPRVKPKLYRDEFRRRFCESLLSRRVLIVEGKTEYDALPTVARRLQQLSPDEFKTFEELGISVINAKGDSYIAQLAEHFKNLNKQVFAICDKQSDENRQAISENVDLPLVSEEDGFENIVLKHSDEDALKRYAFMIVEEEWPPHLNNLKPNEAMTSEEIQKSLFEYFKWAKGSGSIADFLGTCSKDEIPNYIISVLNKIREFVEGES